MATAIAAGSLLSTAGSAAASAGLIGSTALTVGGTAVSFGTLSTGFALAGTALGGLQQFQASRNQAAAQEQASRARARELNLQVEQEKTQQALQEADRERKLRRAQAAQRAAFGSSGVDPFSGSPVAIQQDTESISRRSQNRNDLVSGLRINESIAQRENELRAGRTSASATRRAGRASLLQTGSTLALQGQRFGETL